MSDKKFTHNEMCEIACKWLTRARNQHDASKTAPACKNAFSELKTYMYKGEIVDSIGFRGSVCPTVSILVESKVSISDFKADAKKPWRANPETGVGDFRYYIVPEGMITVEDLPPKWGLIYVNAKGKCSVQCGHVVEELRGYDDPGKAEAIESWRFECNKDAELSLSLSVISKFKGVKDVVGIQKENSRLTMREQDARIKLRDKTQEASHNKYRVERQAYLLEKLVGVEKLAEIEELSFFDDFWSGYRER